MKRNRLTIVLITLVALLLVAGGVAWWWLQPNGTLDVNDYSLDQLVDRSIEAIDPEKKATILSGKAVDKDVLVLNFVDLSIASINDEILSLLDTYNVKATFFVSGINAIEEQIFLSQVHEQKHQIGSLGLDGSEQLDKLATSEVMSQLVRGRALIQQNILNNAYRPLLYAKSTQYNDSFLVRAYAAGHNEVVSHDVILNYRSFATYDQVKSYINKLSAGTSIAIKLQGELSSDEYVDDDTPAIDKPPSVDETLTTEERILQLVTWVVMAIDERDASVVSNQDLQDLPEKEDVIVVPDVETPVLPGTPVQPSISEAQRLRI
ncbi:MAG: polysaccharide deacetylase family protein, partial [Erysipelotrichaceae bacterium]